MSSVFIAHELQFAAVVIVHSCAPREQAFRILAHRRHVQGQREHAEGPAILHSNYASNEVLSLPPLAPL